MGWKEIERRRGRRRGVGVEVEVGGDYWVRLKEITSNVSYQVDWRLGRETATILCPSPSNILAFLSNSCYFYECKHTKLNPTLQETPLLFCYLLHCNPLQKNTFIFITNMYVHLQCGSYKWNVQLQSSIKQQKACKKLPMKYSSLKVRCWKRSNCLNTCSCTVAYCTLLQLRELLFQAGDSHRYNGAQKHQSVSLRPIGKQFT